MAMTERCPCDSKLPYADCCEPCHAGVAALDARVLMRSRYSAFALGLRDYLLLTWHASTRPQALELSAKTHWLGLEVRAYKVIDAAHAQVEFVARSREAAGRAQRLHETSDFVLDCGRWYYLRGILKRAE